MEVLLPIRLEFLGEMLGRLPGLHPHEINPAKSRCNVREGRNIGKKELTPACKFFELPIPIGKSGADHFGILDTDTAIKVVRVKIIEKLHGAQTQRTFVS